MADECTDLANKEQFTICIRWVSHDKIMNTSLVSEVNSIGADTLTHVIKDTLLRMNISLSNCRSQCYDGASNMSGSRTGIVTRICTEEKRAIYVHCYAHALNPAVGTTLKQSKICSDSMDVAFEISKLINFSPKDHSDDDSLSKRGIRTFCPTSILDNYNILKEVWDECLG